jgi:hypothetical protein
MICPYCRGERVAVERTRSYESVVFRWRRFCEVVDLKRAEVGDEYTRER